MSLRMTPTTHGNRCSNWFHREPSHQPADRGQIGIPAAIVLEGFPVEMKRDAVQLHGIAQLRIRQIDLGDEMSVP